MQYPIVREIPYEEIENGALILLLLRDCKTWDELCSRYAYADSKNLGNTNTMMLAKKLEEMRDLGLVMFAESQVPGGDFARWGDQSNGFMVKDPCRLRGNESH